MWDKKTKINKYIYIYIFFQYVICNSVSCQPGHNLSSNETLI